MFRSGAFVAEHITPTSEEQVQPNGVDLTLEAVFRQKGPGRITTDGKSVGPRYKQVNEPIGDALEGEAGYEHAGQDGPDREGYRLTPGNYVVRYAEVISIPEGHVGFLYPRSSLLRNSCMLNTAVWDAGYEGKGEGLLQVGHDIDIETGARVAQLVLAEAEHTGAYDGDYQGENV
ncbi:deoxyuridine 5'-triphosphate nucleotidohydrolase [Haloglomus sp. ZY58]|uniref:deoxyuridine 5'-triphosphate nucleotidohydrolase n=1 Tax=Haloglomus salinum TaxID=2962673 RepID=UPI0020CA1F09